jgi:microcystin degradation protein MlrC
MPRILVASIFHEAHSFSPLLTFESSFVVMRGAALLKKAETSASGLGGAVRRLIAMNATPIPVLSAVAPPGGLIEDGIYEAFRAEILSAAIAERPDGIYLDLHGAIASQSIDDCEGDLITTLRHALPQTPLAASFDLHGNITPRLLHAVTLAVACKHNPHIDYDQAGDRAAELLIRTIRGEIRPVMAAAWVPMRMLGKGATATGPLRRLHDQRESLVAADPALLDMSLFNAQGPLDSAPSGHCVIAISNANPEAAQHAAATLAQATWDTKAEFTPDYPPLAQAITARTPGRPLILGDNGDRVLAGTPGDGTHVLHEIAANWPQLKSVIPVTDPAAAQAAHRAGPGAKLRLSLGGTWTKSERPFESDFEVVHLSEGKFVQRGPYLAGESADVGPTATLRTGNITILATTRPAWSQDPEQFASADIDPATQDLLVAKSGFHFHLSFAGIGDCVSVETPGLSGTASDAGVFPFQRRPTLWPDDPDLVPDLAARLFS